MAKDEQSPLAQFEPALKELEELVSRMEGGEQSLEAALKDFERGIQLVRDCQSALTAAEQKVDILLKSDAEPETFDDA